MGSLFKAPKAPTPTDPSRVIAAQTESNKATAATNAAYNRVNQTDAYGNTLGYAQTGTDAQGNPTFTASQGLGALGQQYSGGLSGLGQKYFEGANDLLANRPDLGSNAAFDRAYQTASANLEPRFERAGAAMENKLRNQGLDPTSEAYRSASNDLALQQNEARNSLVTQLQGQMFNQGLADRQQQVGEFQGLTQPGLAFGSQVISPNLVNVPGVNMAGTDVAGIYNNSYQQQQNAYNQQMANRNAMLGGLASIGGSILTLPMGGTGGSLGGNIASRMMG